MTNKRFLREHVGNSRTSSGKFDGRGPNNFHQLCVFAARNLGIVHRFGWCVPHHDPYAVKNMLPTCGRGSLTVLSEVAVALAGRVCPCNEQACAGAKYEGRCQGGQHGYPDLLKVCPYKCLCRPRKRWNHDPSYFCMGPAPLCGHVKRLQIIS